MMVKKEDLKSLEEDVTVILKSINNIFTRDVKYVKGLKDNYDWKTLALYYDDIFNNSGGELALKRQGLRQLFNVISLIKK